MVRYVVTQTVYNGIIILFHLAIGLRGYVVAVGCFVPSWLQSVSMSLLTNWALLSVNRYAGIPYGMTRAVKKVFAKVFVAIRAMETARMSFGYESVIMTTCCFPYIVLESGPKTSTATNSNRSVAGNK